MSQFLIGIYALKSRYAIFILDRNNLNSYVNCIVGILSVISFPLIPGLLKLRVASYDKLIEQKCITLMKYKKISSYAMDKFVQTLDIGDINFIPNHVSAVVNPIAVTYPTVKTSHIAT